MRIPADRKLTTREDKVMRTISLYLACIVSTFLLTSSSIAQTFGNQAHSVTYEPRYIDRICPPEYPETRSSMKEFIGRFREDFPESAPKSMADIEVLTDEQDAETCSFFAQHRERSINRQVQLFGGSDPYYLNDITLYKGGGFYFVVVAGGILIEKDPDGSGKERWYGAGFGMMPSGVYVIDRIDSRSLEWKCMWRMLQPDKPPGKCF